MARDKLAKLVEILDKKILKAEDFVKKTRESANEAAKTAIASWSAAGDREHTRGQAEIAADNLRKIKSLKSEVEEFVKKEIPSKVEPVTFVKIKYNDGSTNEFYFVKNPIFLTDVKFVSPQSPLGKSISGKVVGGKFKFGKGGEILSIE